MHPAKRCQCLGSLKRPKYSIGALDLFCRNDTSPVNKDGDTYRTMDSLARMANGTALAQIVPNKTRCGNLDPVEMNITDKCYCLARNGQGAGKT